MLAMPDTERSDQGKPVIVHVRNEQSPCRKCGSADVIRIHMSHEDSPIWVAMCASCEERIWSLDEAPS